MILITFGGKLAPLILLRRKQITSIYLSVEISKMGNTAVLIIQNILLLVLNKRGNVKQRKSEGFDSCDRLSNLTKIGFKSLIFRRVTVPKCPIRVKIVNLLPRVLRTAWSQQQKQYIRICIAAAAYLPTFRHKCACMHASMYECIHTCMHAYIQTLKYIHACMHALHTYIHTSRLNAR